MQHDIVFGRASPRHGSPLERILSQKQKPSDDHEYGIDAVDDEMCDETFGIPWSITLLEDLRCHHVSNSPATTRSCQRLSKRRLDDTYMKVMLKHTLFLVWPAMFREISEMIMLPWARKN